MGSGLPFVFWEGQGGSPYILLVEAAAPDSEARGRPVVDGYNLVTINGYGTLWKDVTRRNF